MNFEYFFYFFVCSVSKRQVRQGLCRDLPLHQQWHLQPHRRFLPVFPRLDRTGLLSGYNLNVTPLHFQFFNFPHFSRSHRLSPSLISPHTFKFIHISHLHDPTQPQVMLLAPDDVKHIAGLNGCCNTLCSLIKYTSGQRSLRQL